MSRNQRPEYFRDYQQRNRAKIQAWKADYYRKNLTKIQEQAKDYRLRNKSKLQQKRAAYYLKNKAKAIARVKAWRQDNPERFEATRAQYYARNKAKIVAKARAWEKANPVRRREIHRRSYVRRTYGITREQELQMLSDQRGLCACCGVIMKKTQLDHCHKTGKVRGILCQKCNMGIGSFCESVEKLRAAIAYLERYQ